jgi:tRNA modification GTPase
VNVGKSTIVNRLARRPAAIVSPFAGTTRDVIEVNLDLGGYPVTVLDTAGLRDSADPVEQEGVRRARERAAQADLVLWVIDVTAAVPPALEQGLGGPSVWVVGNKADLLDCQENNNETNGLIGKKSVSDARTFWLSAHTGAGFDALVAALADHAAQFFATGEPALVTRQRHRALLTACADALRRAGAEGSREEIVAEELRVAASALGRLTGRVDVEDVLDVIFRDFCIGK